MTEDPLERLDREERERKQKNTGLRTTTFVLLAIAVALVAEEFASERP